VKNFSLLSLLLLGIVLGCALRIPGSYGGRKPFHLHDVADGGDAARRASQHLLLEGLATDTQEQAPRARDFYERSLQVDPGNPYAYLVLGRHYVEQGEGTRALGFLEKARALFRGESAVHPDIEAHLAGLRGAALSASGDTAQAASLLLHAQRAAPEQWSDGQLSADELR